MLTLLVMFRVSATFFETQKSINQAFHFRSAATTNVIKIHIHLFQHLLSNTHWTFYSESVANVSFCSNVATGRFFQQACVDTEVHWLLSEKLRGSMRDSHRVLQHHILNPLQPPRRYHHDNRRTRECKWASYQGVLGEKVTRKNHFRSLISISFSCLNTDCPPHIIKLQLNNEIKEMKGPHIQWETDRCVCWQT